MGTYRSCAGRVEREFHVVTSGRLQASAGSIDAAFASEWESQCYGLGRTQMSGQAIIPAVQRIDLVYESQSTTAAGFVSRGLEHSKLWNTQR